MRRPLAPPELRRQRVGRMIDAALVTGLVLVGLGIAGANATRVPDGPLRPTRVDLDRASAARLMLLPAVGTHRARQLVEERERAPLRSIDDLVRIDGIGPATVDRIRQTPVVRITVGSMPR